MGRQKGLQETGPESTDRLVIEAIGIGLAQIVVAVHELPDDLQGDEATAQSRAAGSGYENDPNRPRVGDGDVR